jgi:predicted nucleotidyltransferase
MSLPTPAHRAAADVVVDFASHRPVEAVVLVNSCARGVAEPASDLDLALLVDSSLPAADREALEKEWGRVYAAGAVFRELERRGPFARVHLDLFDGRFEPPVWDDGGGPDAFEIEIGNRVAHGVALWERGDALRGLRARWLPYYDETLRRDRLAMVRAACELDLLRVRRGVDRGLRFHAFDRLYHALQEFLQALFIARRVYPIAYDKWIREQVERWLELPEVYAELPAILGVPRLDGAELVASADRLGRLLEIWTPGEAAATDG